ncbi:hypothetical protein TRV_00312 [Trichophyton verrucosum HKI 0517]|uniref:Uncharacterized protein n=1 Tax=Trichophyton verrucosum (strain HKI 0517) TaxID=663202 RepID=D4CZS0_TRIVH|nr:uncharacterized protein TRV_00312 [Trichophyton verrucosum HKI 0517]EFE44939.1 hypothetical protein TRV_00312 [Trichophyton verrucosum HKI 0517]
MDQVVRAGWLVVYIIFSVAFSRDLENEERWLGEGGGYQEGRKGVRPLFQRRVSSWRLEAREPTQSATREQQAKHHWQRRTLQQPRSKRRERESRSVKDAGRRNAVSSREETGGQCQKHLDLQSIEPPGGRTARSSRERDDNGLCAGRETASRTGREEDAAAGLVVERWVEVEERLKLRNESRRSESSRKVERVWEGASGLVAVGGRRRSTSRPTQRHRRQRRRRHDSNGDGDGDDGDGYGDGDGDETDRCGLREDGREAERESGRGGTG